MYFVNTTVNDTSFDSWNGDDFDTLQEQFVGETYRDRYSWERYSTDSQYDYPVYISLWDLGDNVLTYAS